MTVKFGISLPDETHARAAAHAKRAGTSLSRWIDEALRVELARRDAADHVAMLDGSHDPAELRRRAAARRDALTLWKQSGR